MKTTYTKILSVLALLFVAAMVVSCGENDILEPSVTNKDNAEKLELDTVTSRFKYEYTYNDGVVELNDEHFAWFDPSNVARVKQDVIYLKENTPEKFIPKKGDVFVVNNGSNSFLPFGYMGMVDWVDTDARPIAVHVEDATLEEVYKELDLDVRLNAEQLKNLPYAYALVDNETVENTTDGNSAKKIIAHTGNTGSDNKTNGDKDKDNPKIELEMGSDRSIKLSLDKTFDFLIDGLSIKPNGYIKIRPLYNERRVVVHDSMVDEDNRDEGWLVNYDGKLELVYGKDAVTNRPDDPIKPFDNSNNSDKIKDLVLKGAKLYVDIPLAAIGIPTPLVCSLNYIPTLKFSGSVSTGIGLKGNNVIKMKSSSTENEVLQSSTESDLDWGNKFNPYFEALKVAGGVSLDLNLVTCLKGIPVAGACKTTIALSGSADVFDSDLLMKNPKIGFDLSVRAGAYFMKDLLDIEEEGLGIWTNFDIFNTDAFAIFPQYEYAYGSVNKKNGKGSFIYDSNPYYLLYTLAKLDKMKQKVAFVSENWAKERDEKYIVKIAEPVEMGYKGSETRYSTVVSGLNPNTKYYAVPVVDMLGIMKYYGNPVPISEVPSQRICAIGPDYAQTLVDGERMYMTIAYDEKGRPKRIFNTMNAMDTYISYDPLTIKSRDYRINEYGIREYDAPTYITNVVRDEKSGVMTSCRWHDNEDSGTNKFYYDDQYHITGVSNSGTDGWSTMKATWDKRGCLTNIHITDDTGSVTDFTYSYRDDDEYANTQGNWTLATGTFMDDFVFGRLLGRAPSHLPTKLVITSIDKEPNQPATTSVTSCNISYKFAGHEENRYIESEKWSVREDGDGYSLTMPYAYRNITVDEDVLKNDKAVGMNRSMRAKQKSQVASLARIMRKLRLLRH